MSDALDRGREAFDQLVRGDALIGLMSDVDGHTAAMLDDLWAAAAGGEAEAWHLLGHAYRANLAPYGALDYVEDPALDQRDFEPGADLDYDDPELPPLGPALRCYLAAARAGRREAVQDFAMLARAADDAVKQVAVDLFAALEQPSPAEVYGLGLARYHANALAESAATHLRAAQAGSADAMFELHVYYTQGLGVEPDAAEAARWLDAAVAAGHGRALYNLAAAHATGNGRPRNPQRALELYRAASDAGHGRAAATAAVMMLSGEVAGEVAEAAALLDRADALGYPSWDLLEGCGLDDPRGG